MVRKILPVLSSKDCIQLELSIIVPSDTVLRLSQADEQLEALFQSAQSALELAQQQAQEILEQARTESSQIFAEAKQAALCQKRLEELRLEEHQRQYWQKTLNNFQAQLESTLTNALASMLPNIDEPALIKSMIYRCIQKWSTKQSMTIRVPEAVLSSIAKQFPHLILEGIQDMSSCIEIEINDQIHMLSVNDLVKQLQSTVIRQ